MSFYNLDRNQAYRFISNRLFADVRLSYVSDIYGGLSDNKCVAEFGHHQDGYWNDPRKLSEEAFANFFSAFARGNQVEIDYLQQAFPTRVFDTSNPRKALAALFFWSNFYFLLFLNS